MDAQAPDVAEAVAVDFMDRGVAPRRHQRVRAGGLFDTRRCHRRAGLF